MRTISLTFIILLANHTFALQGLMSEADAKLEVKCQRIESYFFKIRKDLVQGTWNPAKAMLNMMLKGNEFGRISTQEASKEFQSLKSDLKQTTQQAFALTLAEQFTTVPYCMRVSDAATLVFKLLKIGVIDKPGEFLQTFLNETDQAFTIQFILYTLHNFLKCSDTFIFQIIDSFYTSRDKVLEEFIKLYQWVLDVHKASGEKAQAAIYKDAFNAVLKQGQAFMGIFLLYQIKNLLLPHLDQNVNWIVDNVFLYKVTEFLTTVAKGVKNNNEKEQIHELTQFFSDLQATLTTQDMKKVDNALVRQGEVVRQCPQCQAEENLQRIQSKIGK